MKNLIILLALGGAVGCSLWDEYVDVELAWAEASPGLVYEKPSGKLTLVTANGMQEWQMRWGEGLSLRVYRWSSGFLVWIPTAGDPQGAVWNVIDSGTRHLNVSEGWLARALYICARNGAPVHDWNLDAILQKSIPKIQTPGPAFWDAESFATGLLAAKEGAANFKPLPVREVSISFVDGEWHPLHEGLPPLTDGSWPLGTWGWSGPEGRLWVHVPADGPALILKE